MEKNKLDIEKVMQFQSICELKKSFNDLELEALFVDLLGAYIWKGSASCADLLIGGNVEAFKNRARHMQVEGTKIKDALESVQ